MAQQLDDERRKALGEFLILLGAAMRGDPDIARKVLDKGVNVNARAIDMGIESFDRTDEKARIGDSDTPLLVAVKHAGNTEIVRLLLDRGADVNAKDEDGKTALMIAIERRRADIIRLLKNASA